jgi:hypothetical protein
LRVPLNHIMIAAPERCWESPSPAQLRKPPGMIGSRIAENGWGRQELARESSERHRAGVASGMPWIRSIDLGLRECALPLGKR